MSARTDAVARRLKGQGARWQKGVEAEMQHRWLRGEVVIIGNVVVKDGAALVDLSDGAGGAPAGDPEFIAALRDAADALDVAVAAIRKALS